MPTGLRRLILTIVLLGAACAPRVQDIGPAVQAPRLTDSAVITADGARLPLRQWLADDTGPVVIALHGFNDYGNAFAGPGAALAAHGVTVYAYDQRGFGEAPAPGLWAGSQVLIDDVGQMVDLARARHPGRPVYLLGVSMGGAVAMAAMADGIEVDGAVLVAPAVWGRTTMNVFYRMALWTGSHTLPWMTVSGRGLDITPSDNREMLIALGRDPLVLKETRIDAIHGVVNLMDRALAAAPAVEPPVLVLYGARDEIIPKAPTLQMIRQLDGRHRVAVYADGYHMLLRDLQAAVVIEDVAAWLRNTEDALPSGQDHDWEARLAADPKTHAGP